MFRLEVWNGTWHPWCDPQISLTPRSHSRRTWRFPAPLQLSLFSPPDGDRRVDSPALSGKGSRTFLRASGWGRSHEEIRDVASWVVQHAERPRFPGPHLRGIIVNTIYNLYIYIFGIYPCFFLHFYKYEYIYHTWTLFVLVQWDHIQSYIMGWVLDYHHKTKYCIKGVRQIFSFPVHVKVPFTLYCRL